MGIDMAGQHIAKNTTVAGQHIAKKGRSAKGFFAGQHYCICMLSIS